MKISLMLIMAVFSLSSYAGPGSGHSHGHGHSHGNQKVISKAKTISVGRYHVKRLVKAGKIDKSWLQSIHDKSIEKKYGKRIEWVVTFDNARGVKGKKLYIFLKLSGDFVAANFSGK